MCQLPSECLGPLPHSFTSVDHCSARLIHSFYFCLKIHFNCLLRAGETSTQLFLFCSVLFSFSRIWLRTIFKMSMISMNMDKCFTSEPCEVCYCVRLTGCYCILSTYPQNLPTANHIKCVYYALAFVKKLAFNFTQDFLVTDVCIFILLRMIKSLVRILIIFRFVFWIKKTLQLFTLVL